MELKYETLIATVSARSENDFIRCISLSSVIGLMMPSHKTTSKKNQCAYVGYFFNSK